MNNADQEQQVQALAPVASPDRRVSQALRVLDLTVIDTYPVVFQKLLKKFLPYFLSRVLGIARTLIRAFLMSMDEATQLASIAITLIELVLTVLSTNVLNAVTLKVSECVYRHHKQLQKKAKQEASGQGPVVELSEAKKVGDVLLHATVLVLPTSALIIPSLIFSLPSILRAMNYSESAIGIAQNYFYWTLPGLPLVTFNVVLRQVLVAVGADTFSIINGFLALLLYGGLGSALALSGFGMQAFAWASLAQATLTFSLNLIYLKYQKSLRETYHIFSYGLKEAWEKLKNSVSILKELCCRGLPIMFQWGVEVLLIFLRNFIAGPLGILAAQGVAGIWEDIIIVFGFALSRACMNRVSHYRGGIYDDELQLTAAEKQAAFINLQRVIRAGYVLALGLGSMVAVSYSIPLFQQGLFLVFAAPSIVTSLFQVFRMLMTGVGIGLFFDLPRYIANAACVSMKDSLFPSVANAVILAGGFGLSELLWWLFPGLGAAVLPIGTVSSLLVAAGVSFVRSLQDQNKLKAELAPTPDPAAIPPQPTAGPGFFSRCFAGVKSIFASSSRASASLSEDAGETTGLLGRPSSGSWTSIFSSCCRRGSRSVFSGQIQAVPPLVVVSPP